MGSLQGQCVVVVGRGGGIARAVTLLARSEGAQVVVAGRDQAALAALYDDENITAEAVDVTDDDSIAALAKKVGRSITSFRRCRQGPVARWPSWIGHICNCPSTPR